MFKTTQRALTVAFRYLTHLEHLLNVLALGLVVSVYRRWSRVRSSGDRGSESVEKAVLVAIGLAVAIGLGVAIRGAVQNYQAQIK
ncbi:hypothetical protein GCM10022222_86090 [Amycolatopsis ultiminotia]|uniref:Uncharacterized protein n=1 Tax=Amycolatopsis ultiminotia TaxID=543629 RepID=A0ABP6YRD4_9PSEU